MAEKKTESKLELLEQAFALGLTDSESCLYAGVEPDELAERLKDEVFAQRRELLRLTPVMRAKVTVAEKAAASAAEAKWFLERRDPEFSKKAEVDHKHGGTVNHAHFTTPELEEKLNEFLGIDAQAGESGV